MTRSLRIEYPGAWYHVMNRGIARQNIFNNKRHYLRFLELLEEAHQIFQIEIHAYCLMSNHYHLLVKTPFTNLSNAMRHINGLFAQSFNKFANRDGPLFKGRFKAVLVDSDSYFLQVGRYIHLNPVVAKIVNNPENYKWSSYKFFIQQENKPTWLYSGEILLHFKNRIDLYQKFIMEGIDNVTKEFFGINDFPIFGSNNFIKKFKNDEKIIRNEEIPDVSRIIRKNLPSLEEVIEEVAKVFNLGGKENIWRPKNKYENFIRNIVIYISSKVTGESQKSISEKFKMISRSGVSQICFRMRSEINNNKKLMEVINNITEALLRKE